MNDTGFQVGDELEVELPGWFDLITLLLLDWSAIRQLPRYDAEYNNQRLYYS